MTINESLILLGELTFFGILAIFFDTTAMISGFFTIIFIFSLIFVTLYYNSGILIKTSVLGVIFGFIPFYIELSLISGLVYIMLELLMNRFGISLVKQKTYGNLLLDSFGGSYIMNRICKIYDYLRKRVTGILTLDMLLILVLVSDYGSMIIANIVMAITLVVIFLGFFFGKYVDSYFNKVRNRLPVLELTEADIVTPEQAEQITKDLEGFSDKFKNYKAFE